MSQVPELFISHRFWRETWALLCPDGAVAVNVIGCDRSASSGPQRPGGVEFFGQKPWENGD
jgi:hypothetical protein